MARKVSLKLATLMGIAFIGQASAYGHHHKPIQFYAGLSGGIERMVGKRTDAAIEDAGGGATNTTIFANNKNISETNANVAIIAGFLGRLPSTSILVGPEFYFGRGNTTSILTDDRFDPIGGTYRYYGTTIQRKLFYGVLLRAGYEFCKEYLVYISLGMDRSQFSVRRLFSSDPLTIPSTVVSRQKYLNGFAYGLGLEKRINCFTVGVDLKAMQYQKSNTLDALAPPAGFNPGALSLNYRPKLYIATLRISYHF